MCKTKFNVGDRVVDKLHNAYEVVEVSSSGITLDVTSITPLPTDALSSKKRLSEEDFPRFIPFSSKKYPLEVLAFSNLRRIHKADEVPSFFQSTLNTLKMGTIIVERQPESKRISFTFMKDFVWETTTEGKDSSILTDQIGFLEGGFKGSEETSFMETLSYIIDDVKDRKVTRRKNEDGIEEAIDPSDSLPSKEEAYTDYVPSGNTLYWKGKKLEFASDSHKSPSMSVWIDKFPRKLACLFPEYKGLGECYFDNAEELASTLKKGDIVLDIFQGTYEVMKEPKHSKKKGLTLFLKKLSGRLVSFNEIWDTGHRFKGEEGEVHEGLPDLYKNAGSSIVASNQLIKLEDPSIAPLLLPEIKLRKVDFTNLSYANSLQWDSEGGDFDFMQWDMEDIDYRNKINVAVKYAGRPCTIITILSEALYHKQETNKGRLSIRDIEGSEITLPEGRFLEEGEELGRDEYVVVGGQYLMQVGSIARGARPLSNSQLQE